MRPGGTWGHPLGYAGAGLILLSLLYSARKRLKRLKGLGRTSLWLKVHIALALLGSALLVFHTAFTFGGIAGFAFWSLAVIVLSGVVGRYIYAQIPRSIREDEMSLQELEGQNAQLRRSLEEHLGQGSPFLARIDAIGHLPWQKGEIVSLAGVAANDLTRGFRIRKLRRDLEIAGHHNRREVSDILKLSSQKALLVRRIAFLDVSRRLFAHWHAFHMPLTFLMLAGMFAHVLVALLFG